MPKTVTVPDFGDVDFPDDMDDNQIAEAIERDIVPQIGAGKTTSKVAAPQMPKMPTLPSAGPAPLASPLSTAEARVMGSWLAPRKPTPKMMAPVPRVSSPADNNFNTKLTPQEEAAFAAWKRKFAPEDSGEDYDLRGAFKAGLTPGTDGHWSDQFKKPNHPTFSDESQYAKYGKPGRWEGETFIPADTKPKPKPTAESSGGIGAALKSLLTIGPPTVGGKPYDFGDSGAPGEGATVAQTESFYRPQMEKVGEGVQDIGRGDIAKGGRKVLAGVGTMASPAIAPAILANPAGVIAGMAAGMPAQAITAAIGEKLGLSEDQAGLVGDLVGAVAGGKAGKRVASRVKPKPDVAAEVKPVTTPVPDAATKAAATADDVAQSMFGRSLKNLSPEDQALAQEVASRPTSLEPPKLTGEDGKSVASAFGAGDLQKMYEKLHAPKARRLFNLNNSDISEEEKLALGRTVAKAALENKVDPFAVESQSLIEEAAKKIDPENAAAIIANIKNSGIQTRAAVYAFRDRINILNKETMGLTQRLNDSTLSMKDRNVIQAELNLKEADLKAMMGHYMGITTEHGRTLASYRMQANGTLDLAYWLGKVKRVSGGVVPETVEQQVRQAVAEGQAATTTETKKAAVTKLADLTAAQHKTTVWDTLLNFRKAGLLGPVTQLTNVGATTSAMILEDFSRATGGIADVAMGLASKQRTVSDVPFASVRAAINAVKATSKNPERYSKLAMADAAEGTVNQAAVGLGRAGNKIADVFMKVTFGGLKKADMALKKVAYEKSIAEQARLAAKNELMAAKSGGSPLTRQYAKQRYAELSAKPTAEMQAQAIYDAQVATFNQDNAISTGWKSAQGRMRAFAVDKDAKIGDGKGTATQDAVGAMLFGINFNVPFVRTPTNVAARVMDYTIGAPVKVGYHTVYQMGKHMVSAKSIVGGMKAYMADFSPERQKVISESIGRGAIGASMLLYGFFKAQDGEAVGVGAKKDSERALDEASGAGSGRIKVQLPGKEQASWMKLSSWAPAGTLITIGATMFEQFADKVGEAAAKDPNAYIDMLKRQLDPGEAGATALNVVAPVLSEMPMVKGLNDVMEVVNSKDKGGSKVNRFMAMQAGSMVPMSSWFSELGAATDKSQRETGADTTSQAMIRGVMSKIPVVRERLAPRVDVLGRPLASSPMDPFRSQTDKSKDPVISELKRLDITLTQPDFVREESMSDLKKRVLRDYDDAAQQPGQSDADYVKALAGAGVIRATRSRDEQHLIQQLAGRMLDKELTGAVNSDGYRQATDDDRTKGLNSIIRDFRADLNQYLKSGEYQSMTKENRLAKLKEMLAGLDVKGQVK